MKYTAFILLMAISLCCYSQAALRKGNDAYRKNDFTAAKEAYLKALNSDSKEGFDKVYYNLGNTFFRSGLFEQAAKSFDDAVTSTKDTTLKANAFYNKGLAFIQQNKTEEAIVAFKNTLRLNPDDNDARDNLQKALNTLPKQQKNTQQKPTPSKQALSAKQAEELLDKLHQKEMQLHKQLHKPSSTDKVVEKDW